MKVQIPEPIRRSRFLQLLLGAFISIVLGAIGSGLWDLLLSRVFEAFGTFLLSTASAIFGGYADLMYRQVPRDPSDNLARLPYMAIVSFLVISPWAIVVLFYRRLGRVRRSLIRTESESETPTRERLIAEVEKERRNLLRFFLPIALFSTVAYASEFYQTFHSMRAASFLQRSITILSPHVDPQTVLELRAQFSAIENARDFYELEDRIRSEARRLSIELPSFESIR